MFTAIKKIIKEIEKRFTLSNDYRPPKETPFWPKSTCTVVGKSEYIYQRVKANQGLRTKSKGWASARFVYE